MRLWIGNHPCPHDGKSFRATSDERLVAVRSARFVGTAIIRVRKFSTGIVGVGNSSGLRSFVGSMAGSNVPASFLAGFVSLHALLWLPGLHFIRGGGGRDTASTSFPIPALGRDDRRV